MFGKKIGRRELFKLLPGGVLMAVGGLSAAMAAGDEVEAIQMELEIDSAQLAEMDVNLNDTFDARVWVQEWLKTIKEHPNIPTDEGTMLGWFANAIMAGYDYAYQEMKTNLSETETLSVTKLGPYELNSMVKGDAEDILLVGGAETN